MSDSRKVEDCAAALAYVECSPVMLNDANQEMVAIIKSVLRDALDAALAPVGVPDGWQLVPKEPTAEQFCAGDEAILGALNNHSGLLDPVTPAQKCYAAMLASAPQSVPAGSGNANDYGRIATALGFLGSAVRCGFGAEHKRVIREAFEALDRISATAVPAGKATEDEAQRGLNDTWPGDPYP